MVFWGSCRFPVTKHKQCSMPVRDNSHRLLQEGCSSANLSSGRHATEWCSKLSRDVTRGEAAFYRTCGISSGAVKENAAVGVSPCINPYRTSTMR